MKVEPCPCCGNTNLFLGRELSGTMAVVCWQSGGGCGLRMYVDWMEGMGKGNKKTFKQLQHEGLKKAVRLWNRRAKKTKTDDAMREGVMAARMGKYPIHCPYSKGSREGKLWIDGWLDEKGKNKKKG